MNLKSYETEKAKMLNFYFDSGSPYTFVKESIARKFKVVTKLPVPESFGGPGNGKFKADAMMHIKIKLLDFWCSHYAYVVEDEIFEEDEDILIGHDFMQKFDIKLDLKKRDIILNKASLKRAQKVRKTMLNLVLNRGKHTFLFRIVSASHF